MEINFGLHSVDGAKKLKVSRYNPSTYCKTRHKLLFAILQRKEQKNKLHCLQGVSSTVRTLPGQGEVRPSSVPPVGGQGDQNPPGDLGGAQDSPLGNPGVTCRRGDQDLPYGPSASEQRPRPQGHTPHPQSGLQVVYAVLT